MSLDLSQCSDGELAALAVSGQERAHREFLARYRDFVYRLVRNTIRDGDEALDVTQETFVAAFAALKRYDPQRPFKLWIARIALNKCRDEAFDLASDSASPETETADRAELARVSEGVARLPAKLREALVLRAVEGITQADAAATLGVTEKTVETRLYRARMALTEMLREKS